MAPPRMSVWPAPATAGQLQLRNLVMGAGTPYAVQTIDGLDLPSIAKADSPRGGTDGSFGGQDTTPSRSLVLHLVAHPDLIVVGPTKALLVRDLKAAFAESSVDIGLTIQDPDLGALLLIGRPRRASYTIDRTAPWRFQDGVLVQFEALDPLLYSVAIHDVVLPFATAGLNAGLPANSAGFRGATVAPLRWLQNGGFEEAAVGPWVGTAGAINNAATLTRDTGTFHGGAAAGKVVRTGGAATEGINQPTLTNLLPNTVYTVSVWVNLSTAGGNITLDVRDVTNAATTLGANPGVTATGVWTRLTTTFTTGATGPVQLQIAVVDRGTNVARTWFVDDAQLDVGAAAQPFVATSALMGATFGAIGGGAGASGFATVTNAGTASSAPVTTFFGPSVGPLVIEHIETGEVITINLSLGAADSLELDHDLHTVILNGATNRQDTVDSSTNWWVLPPGQSTVHYRAFGQSPGSSADFKWRDAWW